MTPGQINPPEYAPLLSTTSNVVAVPKSTIMKGGSYLSIAAIELMILSSPTSAGLITLNFINASKSEVFNSLIERFSKFFEIKIRKFFFACGTTPEIKTYSTLA